MPYSREKTQWRRSIWERSLSTTISRRVCAKPPAPPTTTTKAKTQRGRIAMCSKREPLYPLALPCVRFTKNCYLFLRSARCTLNVIRHCIMFRSRVISCFHFSFAPPSRPRARALEYARNARRDIKKLRERGFPAITCNNVASLAFILSDVELNLWNTTARLL